MSTDYSDQNPDLAALYPAHVETLKARHDDALEKSGAGHAVIFSGNAKVAFLDDRTYPFVANPHLDRKSVV